MSEQRLINALNDCVDRLALGQTIEDCLATYPDLADELRPLLETGQLPTQARADDAELNEMRSRLDAYIENYIDDTDFDDRNTWRLPPGGAVLSMVAVLMLVIGVLLVLRSNSLTVANSTPTTTFTVTPAITATEDITTPTVISTPTVQPESTEEADDDDDIEDDDEESEDEPDDEDDEEAED